MEQPSVPLQPVNEEAENKPIKPEIPQEQIQPLQPPTTSVKQPTVRGKIVLIAIIIGIIASLLVVGLVYYMTSNIKSSTETSTLLTASPSAQTDLTVAVEGSLGPKTYKDNFSAKLNKTLRADFNLSVTDPPSNVATEEASPSAQSDEFVGLSLKVNRIEVHLARATNDQDSSATESAASEGKRKWETLNITKNSFDLLALKEKSSLESLGITSLAAGRYTQIRIYISSATAKTKDGKLSNLDISDGEKVLIISKSFEIESQKPTKLVIDFDAPSSIVKAGDKYLLKPVIAKVLQDETEI